MTQTKGNGGMKYRIGHREAKESSLRDEARPGWRVRKRFFPSFFKFGCDVFLGFVIRHGKKEIWTKGVI